MEIKIIDDNIEHAKKILSNRRDYRYESRFDYTYEYFNNLLIVLMDLEKKL